MPITLLKTLDNQIPFSESRVNDEYSIVLTLMKLKARKGVVREENGRLFFRENQVGEPIEVDGEYSDGYDYVCVMFGNLYIFNSLSTHILRYGRESITAEDWKHLDKLKDSFKQAHQKQTKK